MSGWIGRMFLYREDYVPALQGLKGLAVLWFFHMSFYHQFDPAKMARVTGGKPWAQAALDGVLALVSPAVLASEAVCVLAGFLACAALGRHGLPGFILSRALRFYPVFLLAVLPILAYTVRDWAQLARAFTFFIVPQDIPVGYSLLLASAFWLPMLWAVVRTAAGKAPFAVPAALFAALAGFDYLLFADARTTSAFLAVLAGAAAARYGSRLPAALARHGAGPSLVLAAVLVPALADGTPLGTFLLSVAGALLLALAVGCLAENGRSLCARLLANPFLRFFGAAALPFFLVHTTWGFRLSRSILQGEFHTLGAVAAHYAMSLGFSILGAGFLHLYFERPRFLRNAPTADKTPASENPRSIP